MELSQCLLDALSSCAEGLYVIEEASMTVVYANHFMYRDRDLKASVGEKCYKAFLNREGPCPFCPSLSGEHGPSGIPYVWDYFDPESRQWLKIKNRLVSVEGRQYRVGNINSISDMMELGSEAVKEVGLMQRLVRERDEIREQLLYELSHDRLTGLMNRNQYIRDLQSRYQGVGACGVLFFDLNNLKEANDHYNHSEGDRLLCRLAHTIGAASGEGRRSYRVGGDEFLVIWTGCTKEALETCREEILRALERPNQEQKLPCSVAVGCIWKQSAGNIEQLVSEADKLMYEDKRRIKHHGTE